MTNDWLIGGSRSDSARDRLYAVATDLIAQRGVDAFDINELAGRAHCSRATVYRHAGGKGEIVEAVLASTSTDIITEVRAAIIDLSGEHRAITAITVALEAIRADPVARQFLRSRHLIGAAGTVIASATVTDLASELIGIDRDDNAVAAFAVRTILTILIWPPSDAEQEADLIRGIVAGVFRRDSPI
ncbi:TetR/AcrR family transcriptional regulator [Gordonia hankookensis]|uniref:TetR/AcrR family transcriptional regulator n=1 Tax=Gordonia hankookensis TaxID=589403 RepID=A0ABR7WJJ2_9ACTN|nr:helix-turn-helix domain-containing protein [Gordonia hankookensis]MBD1322097.1 TetR/AcrR family transcriptional regulator [Gordonia hankookensis]